MYLIVLLHLFYTKLLIIVMFCSTNTSAQHTTANKEEHGSYENG